MKLIRVRTMWMGLVATACVESILAADRAVLGGEELNKGAAAGPSSSASQAIPSESYYPMVVQGIRFMEDGHHQTTERMDFVEEGKRMEQLLALRGNFPDKVPLTVGEVWKHLNLRLREEGVALEMVVETNLHPLHFMQAFLNVPLEKMYGHKEQGEALRPFVKIATCEDLINLIGENTKGLQCMSRKGELIWSNHISVE